MHPVLNHFLTQFTGKVPKPAGFTVGNMDGFNVRKNLTLTGGYWVCAAKTRFVVDHAIIAVGPGGGLIGGKVVELKAPKITLEGAENDPVQIVAIDGVSITAENLRVKDVVFYLFRHATFSISYTTLLEFRNVRVVILQSEADVQEQGSFLNCEGDLWAMTTKIEQDNMAAAHALLVQLNLDRRDARQIGVRSIFA